MNGSMDLRNATSYLKRSDSIDAYLSEINKYSVMTPTEEKDIFARLDTSKENLHKAKDDYSNHLISADKYHAIENDEKKIQESIKKEIAERNQRFVFAVAKRYNTGDILTDLISVGTIGLYEAIEAYDWTNGTKFISFAIWYVRRAILAYLNKENFMVRKPGNFVVQTKVKKIQNDFFLNNGRKPTPTEIFEILKKDYNIDIKNELDLYPSQMEYIDESVNNDDSDYTYEDSPEFAVATAQTNSYEKKIDEEKLSLTVKNAISVLNERDRKIILLSYGFVDGKEYTNDEIGEILGLSKERVRQLKVAATKKMQLAMVQTKGNF